MSHGTRLAPCVLCLDIYKQRHTCSIACPACNFQQEELEKKDGKAKKALKEKKQDKEPKSKKGKNEKKQDKEPKSKKGKNEKNQDKEPKSEKGKNEKKQDKEPQSKKGKNDKKEKEEKSPKKRPASTPAKAGGICVARAHLLVGTLSVCAYLFLVKSNSFWWRSLGDS